MRASIVIPNLDCPLVDRTLEALLRQSLESDALEILVVGRDAPRLVPRDGSVRFISRGISPQTLNALLTIDGREIIDASEIK